jgi:serine/threonine protein kinase
MAPEVLAATDEGGSGECGYSLAADVWALGVILFTMAVGRPPFETNVVEETYKKIKSVNYAFPTEEQRKK